MIEEEISHYRIISKPGAGGMGEVYLAAETQLGRRVAIKLLPGVDRLPRPVLSLLLALTGLLIRISLRVSKSLPLAGFKCAT
jgi:serine/threonine protein kinase